MNLYLWDFIFSTKEVYFIFYLLLKQTEASLPSGKKYHHMLDGYFSIQKHSLIIKVSIYFPDLANMWRHMWCDANIPLSDVFDSHIKLF